MPLCKKRIWNARAKTTTITIQIRITIRIVINSNLKILKIINLFSNNSNFVKLIRQYKNDINYKQQTNECLILLTSICQKSNVIIARKKNITKRTVLIWNRWQKLLIIKCLKQKTIKFRKRVANEAKKINKNAKFDHCEKLNSFFEWSKIYFWIVEFKSKNKFD